MAAEQEIYDIVDVEPVVYDRNQIYDSIRPVCTEIINARNEQMNALGMDINPMFNTLEEYTRCIYPIEQYNNLFYDGYNDAGFDKVINPELTGPLVQVTMHMAMRYTLKRDDKE